MCIKKCEACFVGGEEPFTRKAGKLELVHVTGGRRVRLLRPDGGQPGFLWGRLRTVSQTTTALPWRWRPVQQGRYRPMLLTLVSVCHLFVFLSVSACLYDWGLSAKPPPPYPGAGDQSSREGTGPCFWLLFLCISCLSACLYDWGLSAKPPPPYPEAGDQSSIKGTGPCFYLLFLCIMFVCVSACLSVWLGTVSQTTTTLPWRWGPVQQGMYRPMLLPLVSLYHLSAYLSVWGLSAKPPPPYLGAGDQSGRKGTGPCFYLLFLCIICLSVCLYVWGLSAKPPPPYIGAGTSLVGKVQAHASTSCFSVSSVCLYVYMYGDCQPDHHHPTLVLGLVW